MPAHSNAHLLRQRLGAAPDLPVQLGVTIFLERHGCPHTARHSAAVAEQCVHLARRWGVDPAAADTAGWLHDVSAVIPASERVVLAEALGLHVLPEERAAPLLLHQRLSAEIARDVFNVLDPAILAAIACHTTLRADATPLDRIVFVADKLHWDGQGDPPYLAELTAALARSLEDATRCYLDYLWQRRETLLAVHPWFVAAHHEAQADSLTPPR